MKRGHGRFVPFQNDEAQPVGQRKLADFLLQFLELNCLPGGLLEILRGDQQTREEEQGAERQTTHD